MMWLISAYINKKDTFSDVPVSNDSRRYVQDEHQPNVSSDINISPSDENVNRIAKNELDSVGVTNNLRSLAAKIKLIDGTISPSDENVNGESFSNNTKASLSDDLAPAASNDIDNNGENNWDYHNG